MTHFLRIFTVIFVSAVIFAIPSQTHGADLLEQAFQNSIANQQVINIGNTKEAVGNTIFRGGTTINIGNGKFLTTQAPWIVRITQFLLRMTIILSVTFTIYQGVRYILSGASLADEGDAREKLINIVRGIVIALSSVMMIFLVQSLTISSITSDPKPLRDQGYPTATNTNTTSSTTNPVTGNRTNNPGGSSNTPPAGGGGTNNEGASKLFNSPLDTAVTE